MEAFNELLKLGLRIKPRELLIADTCNSDYSFLLDNDYKYISAIQAFIDAGVNPNCLMTTNMIQVLIDAGVNPNWLMATYMTM